MIKSKRFKIVVERIGFSLLVAFLLLGVSVLIYSNIKISKKRASYKSEISILEQKIQDLSIEKQTFESNISQGYNIEYLEESAREDFNLKKQGEQVVAFPVVSQEPGAEALLANQFENDNQVEFEDPEKSFWDKILEKLGR